MQQKQTAAEKTEENKACFAVAICFAVTQSVTILKGLFESEAQTHTKQMDETTYKWYMLVCSWTSIALLYLQDQEDRGGPHRPERTTATKYQS